MSPASSKSLPWIALSIGAVMLVIFFATSSFVIGGIALALFAISVDFFVVQIHKEIKTRKKKKELEALKKEEEHESKELKSEIVGVKTSEE